MKRLSLVFLLLSTFISAQQLKWYDFNSGIAASIKEKKPLILNFYTEWCGYCKMMDKKTYNNPKVKELLGKDFILVRMDGEDENYLVKYKGQNYSVMEFLMAVKVKGFPATGFLDKSGEFITLIPGMIPAETFYQLLLYMKTACYDQSISFEEFVDKANKCEPKKKK
jgi:thioredoxin-related protein